MKTEQEIKDKLKGIGKEYEKYCGKSGLFTTEYNKYLKCKHNIELLKWVLK